MLLICLVQIDMQSSSLVLFVGPKNSQAMASGLSNFGAFGLSRLPVPFAVYEDANNNLFISDTANNVVWKVQKHLFND